jgi:hypothetical protein
MNSSAYGERFYRLGFSGMIRRKFRELLRQAVWEGRGPQFREALRSIFHRLAREPNELGEPLYRLHVLDLNVRAVVVGPLAVHFAVHDRRRLVFIKSVDLLPSKE